MGALALALGLMAGKGVGSDALPMEAVPGVLHQLAALGYGPAALRVRLRSRLRQPLLACASALLPHRGGALPSRDLALLLADGPVARAFAGQTRALVDPRVRVRRYRPWVDQVHPQMCVTGSAGRACVGTAWDDAPPRPPGAPLYGDAYPVLPGVEALLGEVGSPARSATITFPLAVRAPGGERTLFLLPDPVAEVCGWEIRQVTGVAATTRLPATRVTISGRPGQAGSVTVGVDLGHGTCDADDARAGSPPSVVEVPSGPARPPPVPPDSVVMPRANPGSSR